MYTQAGLRVETTEPKCGAVVQQTLIIRYHRIVRVEAIMTYGSQGSYLLCVLELHLGLSKGAELVLKKQDQSYVFPISQIFRVLTGPYYYTQSHNR